MNWLDVVVIIAAVLVGVTGLKVGAVQFAATGLGILVGITMASRLQGRLDPIFSGFIDSDNGAEIAAFIAIIVIMAFAAMVLGMVVRRILKTLMLGWLDQVAGLAIGLVIVFSLGSALLANIQSFPVLGIQDTIDGSVLGSFLADNFDAVLRGLKFIPSDLGV